MIRKTLNRLNPTRQLPKPMRRYLSLPNWLLMAWLVISGALLGPSLLDRTGAVATESPPIAIEPVEPTALETPAPDNNVAPARVGFDSAQPMGSSAATPASAGFGSVQPTNSPAATPSVLALAGDLDTQLRPGAGIYATGSANFSLQRNGDRVELTRPGQPVLLLEGDGESLRMRTTEGRLVYRLKVKEEDQGKIYDGTDSFLFRLKCEAEDGEDACKLYGPTGEKLSRVKFKADSFNVYGPNGERLYKGKSKSGVWEARDEAGRTALSLRGAGSLREAALLALPVEPAVRVLLWRHAGR
ncbi:hypothetical protein [Methylomagnum sp.]